jgi:hypothetical protein
MVGGDTVQCCYREQVAYAWYARFREPRLYRHVVSGDWDLIPARCRSHPHEAAFVHKYAPNDTPLHRLLKQSSLSPSATCETTTTDDVWQQRLEEWKRAAVEAMLRADRKAAFRRDALGRTPLHLACMDVSPRSPWSSSFRSAKEEEEDDNGDSSSSLWLLGNSAHMALVICHANPSAASAVDTVDKRTPLHYLLARNDSIPLALLQALTRYCPAAVHWPDATGDTPLAIVEQNRYNEIVNAKQVLRILHQETN